LKYHRNTSTNYKQLFLSYTLSKWSNLPAKFGIQNRQLLQQRLWIAVPTACLAIFFLHCTRQNSQLLKLVEDGSRFFCCSSSELDLNRTRFRRSNQPDGVFHMQDPDANTEKGNERCISRLTMTLSYPAGGQDETVAVCLTLMRTVRRGPGLGSAGCGRRAS
jgi:hypothetical protein